MQDRAPLVGLLFDKDGTLLDFEATWGPATSAVLAALAEGDHERVEALARSCGFNHTDATFDRGSPIIAGDTDAFAPAWAKLLGLPYDQAFAERVNGLYRSESLRSLTGYGDVRHVLESFKAQGIRIGLATNDVEETARAHLAAMEVLDLFDFVCGYDTGHGAKPGPGMVTAFAAAIGAQPREVALVGDSAHDMATARAAGAMAVGIARTEAARAALGDLPDLLVSTLDELALELDRIKHGARMADRNFHVIENEWITLADGTRLAARIWMPEGAEDEPVPAVFEFLPYRKRDGTSQRDESTYPVFAAAGYAGVRVDMRGSGESEGVIDGEYSPQELSDACEIIDWIAAQAWCTGAVGMMGISWGGFNSLQVAALKPTPLKAIISIASTVDRYNDDIHYKGGCQLAANLSWAATVLCYQSRPPDPALVGERWREMWIERLEGEPLMIEDWLAHQRRDAFWQHGSICEDFSAVDVPALVIAGWADGYRNAPLSAVEGLGDRAKAILGPWIHKYPHFAWPKPRADFHAEAIRWWDRWLKGEENGAEELPQVRAYILDGPRPAPRRDHDPGRWVALKEWQEPQALTLFAGSGRSLVRKKRKTGEEILLASPHDLGVTAGEYFTLKPDAEMAGDQRYDDAGALVFETDPLNEETSLLGRPVLTLTVKTRDPQNLVARLVDVHPDGAATRASFGVLNLAHRDGNAEPQAMPADEPVTVKLLLDACGYRFAPGHRIRLSLSNAYWPMIWPACGSGGIRIDSGSIEIALPLLAPDVQPAEVPEPANPDPLPTYVERGRPTTRRTVERNLTGNLTTCRIHEDTGAYEHPQTGLTTRQVRRETWSVEPDDPLTARGETHWTAEMSRQGWSIRTESYMTLSATKAHWIVQATVKAFEGGNEIHRRDWQREIPRDFM